MRHLAKSRKYDSSNIPIFAYEESPGIDVPDIDLSTGREQGLRMEPQVQTWTIGQLHFTVDTAGPAAGPSVLLLHGFPQTRHMWRHQLPALGDGGFSRRGS